MVTARMLVVCVWVLCGSAVVWAQSDAEREWTDATGKFKVVGRLVEVKEGVAFIKNAEGKTLKVPVAKLSKKDQEFLDSGPSPFEMVESDSAAPKASSDSAKPASSGTASVAAGSFDWSSPVTVDWDAAEEFQSMAGVEWKVPLPESGKLDFVAKRAALAKKSTFHEAMHPLAVNPLCKRAAVGYTVSFSGPEALEPPVAGRSGGRQGRQFRTSRSQHAAAGAAQRRQLCIDGRCQRRERWLRNARPIAGVEVHWQEDRAHDELGPVCDGKGGLGKAAERRRHLGRPDSR